ncbi:hypothetical protein GN316_03450 [Xylophilus sp. Kf1]|nr:hypothetical protein [Xylophilus sp. Kf1]
MLQTPETGVEMILILDIKKVLPGQYSAQLNHESGPIGGLTTYPRLTAAIEAAIRMESAEHTFLEVRYDRISSGTIQLKNAGPDTARDMAIRLIAMHTYLQAQEADRRWGR